MLLHVLRVPFSGVLMSAIGSVILLAGLTIFPMRGLMIRAGVVCMLLKLISPGVAILWPMIGIFIEALILELIAGTSGKLGPLRASLAGAVNSVMVIGQGLFFTSVIYGIDVLRMYYMLLKRGAGWLQLGDEWAVWALVLALVFTFLFGAVAGWLGYRLGLRVQALRRELDDALS